MIAASCGATGFGADDNLLSPPGAEGGNGMNPNAALETGMKYGVAIICKPWRIDVSTSAMCEGRKGYISRKRARLEGRARANTTIVAMMDPLDRDRLRVVLVRTRNPLNIGAVARIMSNFGFLRLRLVQPYEPSFREAKSAVGAADLLQNAELFNSLAEAVSDCSLVVGTSAVRDRELGQAVAYPVTAGLKVRASLASQNVGLVFGSEKTGLSTDDLSHCQLLVRIPTRDEHVSLNLAQAVGVVLYEISREESVGEAEVIAGANAATLERITATLLDALQESGYVKGDSEVATEQKVRRLVRRMRLGEEDSELWLGMLKKMLWRMRRK